VFLFIWVLLFEFFLFLSIPCRAWQVFNLILFFLTMSISFLTAVSPIDGRYHNNTKELANYFSEFALIKYRVRVEVQFSIALCGTVIPQLAHDDCTHNDRLRQIYENFSFEDAQWIKDTEKVTNHDVKAVEYFLKNEFEKLGLHDSLEFIHFGLT